MKKIFIGWTAILVLIESCSPMPAHAQQGVVAKYLRLIPTSLPAVCNMGDVRFDSGSQTLQTCGPTNNWNSVGGTTTVTNGGDVNYSILSTDQYVRSGTVLTANRTWTLPSAISVGQVIIVKNLASQANNVIVAGNGGDLIEGLASIILTPGNSVSLKCSAAGQWDAF